MAFFWSEGQTDLDSLSNVDVYYEKWVKECAESAKLSDFQKLWEVLMIRVTSKAIFVFSPSDEFCNFYDAVGSFLDFQQYIHPCLLSYLCALTSVCEVGFQQFICYGTPFSCSFMLK